MDHALGYIDQRLRRWGEWSASRDDGGAQYCQVRYAEPEIKSTVPTFCPPGLDHEVLGTEAAVATLLSENRRLGLLVVARFRTHPDWASS